MTERIDYSLVVDFMTESFDDTTGEVVHTLSLWREQAGAYMIDWTSSSGQGRSFDESGVLWPGYYNLTVSTRASGDAPTANAGSWSFALVVPEPDTALLLGGGLALLALRRRSR